MNDDFEGFSDLDSDDFLDDGSVKDLSDHYRSFSFERFNRDQDFEADFDDMYALLAALDYNPAKMSNEEIESEYNKIMEGYEED